MEYISVLWFRAGVMFVIHKRVQIMKKFKQIELNSHLYYFIAIFHATKTLALTLHTSIIIAREKSHYLVLYQTILCSITVA